MHVLCTKNCHRVGVANSNNPHSHSPIPSLTRTLTLELSPPPSPSPLTLAHNSTTSADHGAPLAVVDGFQFASPSLCSVYFLSHFHSDHYAGLDKHFSSGLIYCSEITASLVVQQLKVPRHAIRPLPMNKPVLLDNFKVTLVDANHCPGLLCKIYDPVIDECNLVNTSFSSSGAVIFLFELNSGKVCLHTGDFRFCKEMAETEALAPFSRRRLQHPAVQATLLGGHEIPSHSAARKLDILYLDTTYCDPKHSFPPQKVLIDEVVHTVRNKMRNQNALFLFGSYSIGKERVFMEVAQKLNVKMHVTSQKFRMMATFGWPMQTMAKVTTKANETRFHVVPMNHISFHRMETRLSNEKTFNEIIAFQPTGWTFNDKNDPSKGGSSCTTRSKKNMTIVSVPYSEHSNFEELRECIDAFQPKRIVPTVNCSSHEAVTTQLQLLHQH